jgi:hypothetical protein
MLAAVRTALATLLLMGCGASGPVGLWQSTVSVTVESASGPMTSQQTLDIEIDAKGSAAVWVVGGGCDTPLTLTATAATLESANWTCPLQSSDGLPLISLSQYTWKSGDVLLVKSASFQTVEANGLTIQFSLQIRTDPNDPTVGPLIDFQTLSGHEAQRVH